jgi:hypothetical protein
MPLNSRLEDNATVLIQHHLQVPIKFSNQPGKHYAGTIVEIALVICLDSVSNHIQMSYHHNISSTTFLSGIACLLFILALEAAMPFSVL